MFDFLSVVSAGQRGLEILDIGAMVEGTPRYASLLSSPAVHVTAFEPQSSERQRLLDQGGPVTCRSEILGDGTQATLYVARHPGCTSLYPPDPDVIDAFTGIGATGPAGNFTTVSTERVQTTRLDDLDLPEADFVKLDIQGAELLVLQHGRRVLSRALIVEAETMFLPLYKGQPLCCDLQAFMQREGFSLHRYMNVAGRNWLPFSTENPAFPVSQPLWADAVFVRNPVALQTWSDSDLLTGAWLLHALFGSFDLSLRLLVAHDQRCGTSTAQAYVDALRAEPSIPATFFSAAD